MEFNRRLFLAGFAATLTPLARAFEILGPRDLPLLAIKRAPLSFDKTIQRITFGSCNRQSRSQDFWPVIDSINPDLFISLGDNIYGDTVNPSVLETKYKMLKNDPYYRQFAEKNPMVGIWDDHDYGQNNAGSGNPIKLESQQLFCDFFNEPESSPRRKRSGIYTSYDLEGGRIKMIMLDARFNRDDCGRCGPEDDLLGSEQWAWLERELQNNQAEVTVFCSGITIVSNPMNATEDWVDYPYSYQRLMDLLETTKPQGCIFLTGDKHFGGIFPRSPRELSFPVLEVMSSGLTHSAPLISRPIIRAVFNTDEIYLGRNFGELSFQLNQKRPSVTAAIRSITGQIERQLTWPIP